MLAQLNDCIGGLLHLGPNVITFRDLLHLGPNVITFRTLLHLGQLLHLGLQQHAVLKSWFIHLAIYTKINKCYLPILMVLCYSMITSHEYVLL